MSVLHTTSVRGQADAVTGAPVEYRSPLPRLTPRVFTDLALWMAGLGLAMGVAFPFFVVAVGVPARYALTTQFFVASIVAGLIVGAANHLLSRSVVGSRLRFITAKMSLVETLLRSSGITGGDDACTPESCLIRVDSDDELGAVLSSFNRLVAAQAISRWASGVTSRFGSILSSHIEVDVLVEDALGELQASGGFAASALCLREDGELKLISAHGIADSGRLAESELVNRSFRRMEMIESSVPDDLRLDGGLVTFRPRQVFAVPLDIQRVPIGVVILAATEPISSEVLDLVQQLLPGLAVALTNAMSHERLQVVAAVDSTTGLYNRRFGLERLSQEVSRSVRTSEPLGIVLFDIDHFKHVNDTHGHHVGDDVLRAIASSAKSVLREGDTMMRYGGEEFLAVLPGAGQADVRALAERLRQVIETTSVTADLAEVRVTISLGAVSLPSAGVADVEELIRRADEAMYESKKTGRNRLTLASDSTS